MTAPVLAVGIGSWGNSDDAAGLLLAQAIARRGLPEVDVVVSPGPPVELLDGSTRELVLVLDAVRLGASPGTVHLFRAAPTNSPGDAGSHRWRAVQWLGLRQALGCPDCPVAILGIEPATLEAGLGVTPEVLAGIELAVTKAEQLFSHLQRGELALLPPEPLNCL
ncbi:MAG: hydrogenase maturation protease [Thermoanaerobaculia bacterium]